MPLAPVVAKSLGSSLWRSRPGRFLASCRQGHPCTGGDRRGVSFRLIAREQDDQRPIAEVQGFAPPQAERCVVSSRRVQHAFPDLPVPCLGQCERDRLMMGVEQDQGRLVHDRLAPLVHVADEVAGQPHAQALDVTAIPILVGHLLAGGIEERKILDVGAAEGPALEELPPLEDRMLAPDPTNLPGEIEEFSAAGRSGPSSARSARCPGNRRCCCPAGCARSRRRPGSWRRPGRASAWPGNCASAAREVRERPGCRSVPRLRSSSYRCCSSRRGSPRRWPRYACRCRRRGRGA